MFDVNHLTQHAPQNNVSTRISNLPRIVVS